MYDLIGDIHGHARELTALLERLGYDCRKGHYSHPTRTVVFVGDLIDRGPQIRDVLHLVRTMVQRGSALVVMGNHEFNALCYHTPHGGDSGDFIRPHDAKNVKQHQQTLAQVPPDELRDYLEWFRTLPLALELDGLRVVHACWDAGSLALIQSLRPESSRLSDEFLRGAGTYEKGNPELFNAVETVLKGPELELPKGLLFVDKDGHQRREMRTRWFESPRQQSYRSFALPSDAGLPDCLVPGGLRDMAYDAEELPVFIGHYWLQAEEPCILAPNVACLDYSVAKGGMLVAYRWNGEPRLSNQNFVTVKSQ